MMDLESKKRKYLKSRKRKLPFLISEIPSDEDIDSYLKELKLVTARGFPASELTLSNKAYALLVFKGWQWWEQKKKNKNLTPDKAKYLPWSQVKKEHIKEFMYWLVDLDYEQGSIATLLSDLKAFFNFMLNEKKIVKCQYCGGKIKKLLIGNSVRYICKECDNFINPVCDTKIPKRQRRDDPVLTLEEINKLLTYIRFNTRKSLRNEAFFRLLVETGARISEILSIGVDPRKCDNYIDFKRGVVVFRKTKGKQRIKLEKPLTPKTLSVCLDYVLYLSKKGKFIYLFDISRHTALQNLYNWAEKAGINKNVYLHLIRATWATNFWKKIKSEIALQKAGGWTSDAYKAYIRYSEEDIFEMTKSFVSELEV